MNKYKSARRGRFIPKNPSKWISPKKIEYKSSIEQRFFTFFDLSKSVIKIASEKVIVPYYDTVRQKRRRYYVDLIVQYRNNHDEIFTKLIEIKSFTESIEPKKPKRMTENYKNSVATYITNTCKWEAATAYAEQKGWTFIVLTERDLKR